MKRAQGPAGGGAGPGEGPRPSPAHAQCPLCRAKGSGSGPGSVPGCLPAAVSATPGQPTSSRPSPGSGGRSPGLCYPGLLEVGERAGAHGWEGAGDACPSTRSRFRLLCHRIITHKMFDHVVLVIIFLNCITIAMERPKIDPHSAVSHRDCKQGRRVLLRAGPFPG